MRTAISDQKELDKVVVVSISSHGSSRGAGEQVGLGYTVTVADGGQENKETLA